MNHWPPDNMSSALPLSYRPISTLEISCISNNNIIMVLMRWVRGLFSIVAWSRSVLNFLRHILFVSYQCRKKWRRNINLKTYQMVLMNIIDGFNEQILIIAIWLCQYNTFRLLIIKLLIYNMNLLRTKFDYLSWTISMTIYMGRGRGI